MSTDSPQNTEQTWTGPRKRWVPIVVLIVDSLRVGQVTLLTSCRTSRINRDAFANVMRLSPLQIHHARLAGVGGLEPTTPGFGDRCSTN